MDITLQSFVSKSGYFLTEFNERQEVSLAALYKKCHKFYRKCHEFDTNDMIMI